MVGDMRRRRGWRAKADLTVAIFMAVIFVVFFPVIVFVVLPLAERNYRKRLEAAARAFACLSCGRILGFEAIQLGDAAWRAYLSELRDKYPSRRFRLVRHLHAVCPACGAHYTFVERERTFVRVRADRTFRPAGEAAEGT
jgi:hypothetical protein